MYAKALTSYRNLDLNTESGRIVPILPLYLDIVSTYGYIRLHPIIKFNIDSTGWLEVGDLYG